ncbi:NADH:flavin oxidoreductase [Alcanivorax hongdengensis A-11-3]|uniref:NADH:flavin oxidoreductase n=1 Tax=Alcanivorax hongdengensis A-11-3 TaxID=1177179 RepID=L0WEW2_9GAMM|nr:NADH:flavin oxidoreductase/NADH oxidase family protein [Alcanivorax hongdengensis]EKF75561.1 NADH:flavin oxidoreductase [Alcanivorax hongdengensis A-11-3]
MSHAQTLGQSLALPCGATLGNRFAKSAMSEALGTIDNHATEELVRLYQRWAEGGTGLLITGNIMVDRHHTGEPNNVVLEDETDMALLQRWAEAGKSQSGHIWVQLNHPGKQIPRMLASGDTLAPSAVPFGKELKSAFKTPRALTEAEIRDIIQRFATSAAIAKKAGFTGVQIHGAHGYLVSQFLSGHHNRREDQWGGSLENRMRFPLEIYRAIRKAVGDAYPVSIKLNSADFQRGGFTEEESMTVAETLAAEGLDLLEISGGNYENPAMAGAKGVRESTVAREAYFLDYANEIRKRVSIPLMVTGGFRSAKAMADAIDSGATDLVGIARPLAVEPDLPNRILAGQNGVVSRVTPRKTGIKAIDEMAMMEVSWFSRQLHRMGKGKDPRPDESVLFSLFKVAAGMGMGSLRTRRMRANS